MNFTYYAPTKMIFEQNAEMKVGEMMKQYGYKKILIHYGMGSVIRSGLMERVEEALKNADIEFVKLGGVVPNPLLSKVKEGIELGKKEKIEAILALGGGSVIDSAKAIGMGICYDGDVWDLFDGKATPVSSTPITTILTLAATGSEMSNSSVITNEDGMLKRYCGHDDAICKFALMNPELMLTLPAYQTSCGCVDILMHTMERYFNTSQNLDITDEMAESLMRSVIRNAKVLMKDPKNLEARWNIMWAGSLSHNGLTGCGTGGGDWSTHDIEHELGGMYDVAHGAGLAAIWGSWARYVYLHIPHRFEKFALHVMGVAEKETPLATGLAGIEAMEKFYKELHMPISLTELDIDVDAKAIDEMALKATHFGEKEVGTVKRLHKDDIQQILTNAI